MIRYYRFLIGLLLGMTAGFAGIEVEGDGNDVKGRINVPTPAGGQEDAEGAKGKLSDVLRFKDGDLLHGNLVNVDDKGMLTWSRPDIASPIVAKLDNMRFIKLFKHNTAPLDGTRVELTNDDVLYGSLRSFNEDELVLETWFAGTLEIPRLMIRNVRPGNKKGAALVGGMGKLADWEYRNGDWTVKKNQMSAENGQLGRNANLPDKAHLQVAVAWQNSYPSYNIVTYASDIRQSYRDCYNLQINGTSVRLSKGNNESFGNFNHRELRKVRKARLDLYIDRSAKNIVLMIDDVLVKEWRNVAYQPTGTGIMLIAQGGSGNTTFSNLRVEDWDGKLPNLGTSAENAGQEDTVRFINGDKMSGNVVEIQQNVVTLKTAFATMPVPLDKIVNMTLSEEEHERARRNAGDVNLYFPGGDHITMKLLSLENDRVTGMSENFGTKVFDLKAFVGMRFNIYDEGIEEQTQTELEELILAD